MLPIITKATIPKIAYAKSSTFGVWWNFLFIKATIIKNIEQTAETANSPVALNISSENICNIGVSSSEYPFTIKSKSKKIEYGITEVSRLLKMTNKKVTQVYFATEI